MSCVALAVGDACVAFAATLVIFIVSMLTVYPAFFLLVYRPLKIRHEIRRDQAAWRGAVEAAGETADPADGPRYLSMVDHSRLFLDIYTGRHRPAPGGGRKG